MLHVGSFLANPPVVLLACVISSFCLLGTEQDMFSLRTTTFAGSTSARRSEGGAWKGSRWNGLVLSCSCGASCCFWGFQVFLILFCLLF